MKGRRARRNLLGQAPSLALGLALLLQGCAGLIQGKEELPVPGESFQVRKGRPGMVIGAPRGSLDGNTGVIAADLAHLTGFGLVVAQGPAGSDRDGRPPRPSLAGFVAPLDRETGTAQAYRRHVAEAAQGPLRLYVEVYGNGSHGGAGRVEITTVGLGPDDAWRLRTLFELIRDSHLDEPSAPRLEVRVESLDLIASRAAAARQGGLLAEAPRALSIDLPQAARTTYRKVYTQVLGAFLSESVNVLKLGER
jgi:hypothetical protein